MSYFGFSIGEALSELSAPVGGRLFPQVQSHYAWGTRHESEQYVRLLLGSPVKGCPRMTELVRKPNSEAN